MLLKEYSGIDCISQLEDVLRQHQPKKILLVTGRQSFENNLHSKCLLALLNKYAYVQFNDFCPNPQWPDLARGIAVRREQHCDFIIAVGGGSVIDMAKLINLSCETDLLRANILLGESVQADLPLIAIPTTAGTGSEATHFAVLYIDAVKYSIAHASLLPTYVFLDPKFLYSLPQSVAACAGLDALTQAIESFWSVRSTDISKNYATRAIDIILKNIILAVNHGNADAQFNMLIAANLAGKAINITKTTAPHALSYWLTSHLNIPHGHAVALMLPYFFHFNAAVTADSVLDKRGVHYVKNNMQALFQHLNVSGPAAAEDLFKTLMQQLRLAADLAEVGIATPTLMRQLINHVNAERLANNPRCVTKRDLEQMLICSNFHSSF